MSISDVQHQDRALRLIRRALECDRMPHAYIFHGPSGVGRELLALGVARMVLCEQPADDACNACRSCEMIAAGTHPDLHLIYRELIKQHPKPLVRARKGIDLGIDVIRHFVIERVATKPRMGHGKVFIIREAEKMNTSAQNALLKALEEPPGATVIILIATSLDAMLETVRSRCQEVAFGLLPPDFIEARLRAEHAELSDEDARFCVRHAGGSLGAALQNHSDGLNAYDARLADAVGGMRSSGVTGVAKVIIEDAKKMGERHQKRDADISNTEAQRRGLKSLLSLLAAGFRDALHEGAGADGCGEGRYASFTGAITPRRAADAIRTIASAERQLDFNANTQLCVEGLLVRLNRLLDSRPAAAST